MVSHSYDDLTIKKLYGLHGNQCAFPSCQQELITADTKTNISDICHIEGGEQNSPRYNPNLSPKQLNDYENLILMCKNHHKIIDSDVVTYTVEYLQKIKREHEQKNKGRQYSISDEMVKKIIAEQMTQINVNPGSGNQNVTQTGNIIQYGITSISDAEKLFEILFEKNFPKLREEAQKTAHETMKKYYDVFLKKGNAELTSDDIKKLSEPDVQYVLTNSIIQAGRKDEPELRENLALLLVERIKNSDNDLRRIVYNEAIDTIGKLTIDGLKIITLCFILRYTLWEGVFSLENLDELMKTRIIPFLDFKNTNAEFQHIVYAGCGELGIGEWNYPTIVQNQYYGLEPMTISKSQLNIHRIPEEIIGELFSTLDNDNLQFNIVHEKQLEDYLAKIPIQEIVKNSIRTEFSISKNRSIQIISTKIKEFETIQKVIATVNETGLKNLSLTSVGIVIGAMYYERITGEKINISIWIN